MVNKIEQKPKALIKWRILIQNKIDSSCNFISIENASFINNALPVLQVFMQYDMMQ